MDSLVRSCRHCIEASQGATTGSPCLHSPPCPPRVNPTTGSPCLHCTPCPPSSRVFSCSTGHRGVESSHRRTAPRASRQARHHHGRTLASPRAGGRAGERDPSATRSFHLSVRRGSGAGSVPTSITLSTRLLLPLEPPPWPHTREPATRLQSSSVHTIRHTSISRFTHVFPSSHLFPRLQEKEDR